MAMVGARNASANGRRLAERFALGLAGAGYNVVSGLARGIDSAAHRGALAAEDGGGGTIAVVAGGVDVCYPEENRELYGQIRQQGLVLAEPAPGRPAPGPAFPQTQQDHLGALAGSRGGRGGASLRFADHGPSRPRPGAAKSLPCPALRWSPAHAAATHC